MDYSELLVEVRGRSGLPFVIERGARLVRAAERYLEKHLRPRAMEASALLATDEDGIAALPDDFLQPFGEVEGRIVGNELHTNIVNGAISLRYYAALPSVEVNTTNWLLTDEPEVYVQALLMQAYIVAGDAAKAAAHKELVDALIQDIRSTDLLAKFANRKVEVMVP